MSHPQKCWVYVNGRLAAKFDATDLEDARNTFASWENNIREWSRWWRDEFGIVAGVAPRIELHTVGAW